MNSLTVYLSGDVHRDIEHHEYPQYHLGLRVVCECTQESPDSGCCSHRQKGTFTETLRFTNLCHSPDTGMFPRQEH